MHRFVIYTDLFCIEFIAFIYFQTKIIFQARGLRRWCSFIVFMRDKQFLLNMWPFLVDNLKELIRELQDFAEKKYNDEEAECPQRVVRLAAGSQSNSNKQARSLSEITNEKHIFVRY